MNTAFLMLLVMPAADPTPQDSDLIRGWLNVGQKQAQDYVIATEEKPDRKFTLLPQAIFRHTQPVRGDDIGAVYLWVDEDKRPAAIGDIFAFTHQGDLRAVVHEFHSLSDSPVTAKWREQRVWTTNEPGLKFSLVPKAPRPESTARLRQRQARDIANRFTAHSTEKDGKRWELRMPPKPIYDFDLDQPDRRDAGALFVFCQGTDPELILSIEAKDVEGTYLWRYAAASFTDYQLTLQLDDAEVWTSEFQSYGRNKIHTVHEASKERLPGAAEGK